MLSILLSRETFR